MQTNSFEKLNELCVSFLELINDSKQPNAFKLSTEILEYPKELIKKINLIPSFLSNLYLFRIEYQSRPEKYQEIKNFEDDGSDYVQSDKFLHELNQAFGYCNDNLTLIKCIHKKSSFSMLYYTFSESFEKDAKKITEIIDLEKDMFNNIPREIIGEIFLYMSETISELNYNFGDPSSKITISEAKKGLNYAKKALNFFENKKNISKVYLQISKHEKTLGNMVLVQENIKESINFDTENCDAYFEYAEIEKSFGNYELAIELLHKVLKIENEQIKKNFSIFKEKNSFDNFIHCILDKYYIKLGVLHLLCQEYDIALENFMEVRNNVFDSSIKYLIGLAYKEIGDNVKAKEYFNLVVNTFVSDDDPFGNKCLALAYKELGCISDYNFQLKKTKKAEENPGVLYNTNKIDIDEINLSINSFKEYFKQLGNKTLKKMFETHKKYESGLLKDIEELNKISVKKDIMGMESNTIEFKTGILWSKMVNEKEWCEKTKNPSREIISHGRNASLYIIAKSIAAIMNTKGGKLIIGIKEKENNEEENYFIGINKELNYLKDNYENFNYSGEDGYSRLIVDKILRKYFPSFIYNNISSNIEISFIKQDNKEICVIEIFKSKKPIYLNKKEFYIRCGAQTRKLDGEEIGDYILENFK